MRKLSVPLATLAMIGLLAGAAARAETPDQLLGVPVPPSQAQRTVDITPGTKWVNVTHGDVVKFESEGQEFAFDFVGADDRSFDLASIAPVGAVSHPITVYVSRDPELD